MTRWYLEGFLQSENASTQQTLGEFPVLLGRDEALSCVVKNQSVSRRHARIEQRSDTLWLVDLDSRNGTYVNRVRIVKECTIDHGDVIHLGTAELRLIDSEHTTGDVAAVSNAGDETSFIGLEELSDTFPSGVRELEQLIENEAVAMVFQPIITAAHLNTCGYEILGRGASSDLPVNPLDLFRIAESVGLEITLSQLIRDKGVAVAVAHKLQGQLLVNTHPSELNHPDGLIKSLRQLRKRHPSTLLTLEIHEQSVTGDSDLLRNLKQQLDPLSIKLAFDDFGVGQSRLVEIIEARPNLIKFDRLLINGIDKADASKINLLRHLKELASELSIHTLAECVETEEEYKICQTMGFSFYQGYYFAKPQPAKNFIR